MPGQYWLTIRIRASDSGHRVNHGQPVRLKVNFDENPQPDDKKRIRQAGEIVWFDGDGSALGMIGARILERLDEYRSAMAKEK